MLNPLADRALGLDDGTGSIFTTDDAAQMAYDFLLGGTMGLIGGSGQLRRGQTVQMPTLERAQDADAAEMPQLSTERLTVPNTARLNNENGLSACTPQERINLSSGVKNKIVSTYQEVLAFVKNALSNKQSVDRAYMGVVPNSVASRILKETGVDVSGYGVMMNGNDVRHILKSHGDSAAEAIQGQVAVTEDAIAQIPKVIAAPDNVYLSADSDGKGRRVIVFEKQIGDTYITIQGVSDGKRLLQADTMYIRKRKTRKSQDTMLGAEHAAPVINARSELPLSLSSDTTVPQGTADVNTQGSTEYTPLHRAGTAHQGDFNPRAPYGARLDLVQAAALALWISIHAPLTGRDYNTSGTPPADRHFNPRAPYGARHHTADFGMEDTEFQSTRPLRGAT